MSPLPAPPRRPLRVLFFDHVATMSGGEIALLHLLQHLDRTRVEPIVALGEDGPLAARLQGLAPVHVLPIAGDIVNARKDALGAASLLRLGAVWNAVAYVFRLSRFMRQQRLDLVHTNSLKSDILAGLAARLARVPLIWHIRDRISEDYLPPRVVSLFQRLCRVLPTAIVANSRATAVTLNLKPRRPALFVVHDGTILTPPAPRPEPSSSPIIGLIGRISPWKGQDVFLQAAAILRPRYPGVTFRIIGKPLFNEVEWDAGLRRLTTELDLDHSVDFVGFREDIPAEIASLTVLVHASVRAEPFGQVIIEGMAARVPVVATNGGGVPEIVAHGVTGLLVPMGDPGAMAAAIDSLLADPARALRIAERGRLEVERRFSIDKTAREMEQVFTKIAALHPVPHAAADSSR